LDNEVYVIPFKFKHLQLIKDIHDYHRHALNVELTMRDLPRIGYIAMLGKSAIAVGFLRRVEPNYAQLDTFLSNPFFGSQIRHQGMTLVTEALINEAKDLGLKGIIALTKDKSILDRAKNQGFQVVEQTIMAKYL
jgi:hypothetical protein